MAKKKRTKKYRGRDAAAPEQPVVKRFSATQTSPLKRWYEDNKQTIILRSIFTGLTLLLVAALYTLANVIF